MRVSSGQKSLNFLKLEKSDVRFFNKSIQNLQKYIKRGKATAIQGTPLAAHRFKGRR